MRKEFTWMLFLIMPLVIVTSRPTREDDLYDGKDDYDLSTATEPDDAPQRSDDGVISVSITSSVAVDRGPGKAHKTPKAVDNLGAESASLNSFINILDPRTTANATPTEKELSSELAGANMEFIKQLHSKKETRGTNHLEAVHPFQLQIKNFTPNDTISAYQSNVDENVSIKDNYEETQEDIENIPLGRSVAQSPSSRNYIQGLSPSSERGQGPRLTTVSFNIAHDTPKPIPNYNERQSQSLPDLQQLFNQAPKVYSQPAKIYSEPAKIYSEPAKIYSEPAKVYSEPAKVYGEPAKVYSEPAKFYSPAASLNLPPQNPIPTPWDQTPPTTIDTTVATTPASTTSAHMTEHQPEKNYEVDEKDSVQSHGRMHGVQKMPENCKDDSCKVGYVVEGRQFRKYRVEEKTPDGFIVGEYGVVRNEDGALHGVRYTADGNVNPQVIYDALLKFLQL